MRLRLLFVLAAPVLAACQAAPGETGPAAGYRGIEKVSLLAKGME